MVYDCYVKHFWHALQISRSLVSYTSFQFLRMNKSYGAICAILTINFASVIHCKVLRQPPTLVDKLVSDHFEVTEQLWTSVEKRTPNVLDDVEKLFDSIRNDQLSDMMSWLHFLFIDPYNIQLTHLTLDLFMMKEKTSYQGIDPKSIKDVDDFQTETRRIRNATDILYHITSKDEFWQAALARSSPSSTVSFFDEKFASQQMILRHYFCAQVTYLRNYLQFQQLYMTAYIKFDDDVDYESLAMQVSDEFQAIYATLRVTAKKYLRRASTDILTCKIDVYSGETINYTTVTDFLRGYVDNEANLNPQSSCSSQCSDYSDTKHFHCHTQSFCGSNDGNNSKLLCNGVIRDCSEIDSSFFATTDAQFCLNNDDPIRRYDGIKIDGKLVAGDYSVECREIVNARSWRSGLYRCTNCYCLCDDTATNSERHFSLRDVVSNILDNRVITDVRMNKINGVIHFEIKESNLLPFADTSKGNRSEMLGEWISAPAFSVVSSEATKNVDYFELTYEKRSMNLDEVKVPNGRVLTGVRFSVQNDRLTLEVRGTAFDYTTGMLQNLEDSVWYSNVKGSNEFLLDPLRKPGRNHQYEMSDVRDAFIKFRPSDYALDIGQTTIPFIEVHSTKSRYSGALAGAGLVYKSRKNIEYSGYYLSGHYVTTKLIAYDVEPHFVL